MTREEAITVLKAFMENPLFSDEHKQAFNIAIHDIKQRHDWDINNLILINKDDYKPLEQEPTAKNKVIASVTPIRSKGHWIDKERIMFPICSKCGLTSVEKYSFCPNCGARMESDLEKRKPCINYSDGCEEWAGCPCVYYKAESEDKE